MKWNKQELTEYKEKFILNESSFKREYLCEPSPSKYCHDFDKKHYFVHNKCEICGIGCNKFRDLIERGVIY